MARFAQEHPEYVQAEQKEEDDDEEVGPSTVIPVESDSSDWADSEEEDEGCDDPDNDDFWEQFKSSSLSTFIFE